MPLQTDCDTWTVTAATQSDESFNDTFDTVPAHLIVMAFPDDKKKSGVLEGYIDADSATVFAEVTGIRYFAKEPGYDAGSASTHPPMDSGTLQVTTTKVLESVSFNQTFSAVPIVITGFMGYDEDNKGGKTSAANRTTTGCDVATEIKDGPDNCNWVAVYTNGFWEPS